MYKKLIPLLLLIAFIPSLLHAGEAIKCASTTATHNSGILEYLFPIFEQATGIDVQVTTVGNSEALELGRRGEVDVVLTHAEDLEIQLVDEGYFIDREEIMYTDSVILGPTNDPAGVKGTEKVLDAFIKIRTAKATFLSRGDNSEANMLENRIWAMTGSMPERNDTWYLAVGQKMDASIHTAALKQAYTLADRATWYSMEDKDKTGLSIVLEGDPILFNQYGVMIVNPKNHKHINYQSAMNFVIWLTSPTAQDAIGAFRDKSGNVLFTPNAR
ncbi:MAG TPA: tungsten ABC transporter substrate-binding protein [Desulfocapsa sulfexigens]|nr:tungsten ABC transporter substrate-binding protein [Desulfocapsa sulfexigens]